MCASLTSSRLAAEVDYSVERSQAEIDELELQKWERRERIESAVTFDDLLEEVAGIGQTEQVEFMECLACADRQAAAQLFVTLNAAKERIIKRRLAQGE